MSTWIKLNREISKHWIFKDEWKFKCWIDLLMLANYAENKVDIKGVLLTCKRGELLYSLDSLSSRWNTNKSKVRRFLKLLESDSMIVLKSEQVTTRITICNYESYQGERNADETQTKHKRNTNETQTTPIKEIKKYKERKEESTQPLCLWIKSELKNVSKITNQLTNEEAERLLNNFEKDSVKIILEAMENSKDLSKKNTSVNLTIRNWIRRRQESNPNFGVKQQKENLSLEQQILKNYKG